MFYRFLKWLRNSTKLEKIVVITIVIAVGIALFVIQTKEEPKVLEETSAPAKEPLVAPLLTPSDLTTIRESTEREFEVIPLQSTSPTPTPSTKIYHFDVESEKEHWNASGMWHITSNRYSSHSHSFWYGNETTKNYDTGTINSGELISPEIDLNNSSKPVLYFMSWYQTETNNTYDKKIVYISVNNGSWINLKQINHTQNTWVKEQIDLSGYANKKIRIRFFFDTVNNKDNKYEGWYIDDVEIMEE